MNSNQVAVLTALAELEANMDRMRALIGGLNIQLVSILNILLIGLIILPRVLNSNSVSSDVVLYPQLNGTTVESVPGFPRTYTPTSGILFIVLPILITWDSNGDGNGWTGSQSDVSRYNIINPPKWGIAQSGVSKNDKGKKSLQTQTIFGCPILCVLETSISTSTYTGANKRSVRETLRPTGAKYCTCTYID